jgi:hypothetical protein
MGADLILIGLPCPPDPYHDLTEELGAVMWWLVMDHLPPAQDDLKRLALSTWGSGLWSTTDDSQPFTDEPLGDVELDLERLEVEVFRIYSGQLHRNETWIGAGSVRLLACGCQTWGDTPDGYDLWVLIADLLNGVTMPWEMDRNTNAVEPTKETA